MKKRTRARELALQFLYQVDVLKSLLIPEIILLVGILFMVRNL